MFVSSPTHHLCIHPLSYIRSLELMFWLFLASHFHPDQWLTPHLYFYHITRHFPILVYHVFSSLSILYPFPPAPERLFP